MDKYQELELYIEEPIPTPEKKIDEDNNCRTVVVIDLYGDEEDDGSIDI